MRNWRKSLAVMGTVADLKIGHFTCVTVFLLVGLVGSEWKRVTSMPVIAPIGTGWESAGTFNPATVLRNGKIVLIYRAQDAGGSSRLGYAESVDGIHFKKRPQPIFSGETDYERDGGVEDPRIIDIDGLYYMTYTGYDKKEAQLCLAVSADLVHWERKGILLPAYRGNWNVRWTKSGAILREKIQGKYWMYWLGTTADEKEQMGISSSTDLVHWMEETKTPVLRRREGKFDSRVVEPGPPPILTKDGIVLVYNGADDKLIYRTGIAVFDRNDPRRVIFRSEEPVFEPELQWEKVGQVPNVVFVEGMVKKEEEYLLYYGAADKFIGVVAVGKFF